MLVHFSKEIESNYKKRTKRARERLRRMNHLQTQKGDDEDREMEHQHNAWYKINKTHAAV